MKYEKSPITIDHRGRLVVDVAILKTKGIQKEIDAARKLKDILSKRSKP